jgi:hypothetical protein
MAGKAVICSVERGHPSERENQPEPKRDIESETLPPSYAQALRRFKVALKVCHDSR